jgi:hypothetical protein
VAAPAAVPVAGWVTELTADPAALVTVPTVLLRGLPLAAERVDPADTGPAVVGPADVVAEAAPEFPSPVAAWACLEKSSRRKIIPAAASVTCAARTATRYTSGCDIDSSHP